MKKLILVLIILLIAIIGLISCNKECEHQWIDATCNTPKTCKLCTQAEGTPREHEWKWPTCLTPKTCKMCGLVEGEVFGHNWTTLNCESPKKCTRCNLVGERKPHTWSTDKCLEAPICLICQAQGPENAHMWESATCEKPITCQKCGEEKGSSLGHNWNVTTCKEPKVCGRCDKSSCEGLPHDWIFRGCNEYRICSICVKSEATIYGHTWKEANCKEAKHCLKCNATEGDRLEHSWQEATCEQPKKCTSCGTTEGKILSHKYELIENIKPNCEAGYMLYKCSNCNKENIFEYEALYGNHICNEDGICTRCEKSFDTSKMVLESVGIGNLHSIERCGIFTSEETSVKIFKSITYKDVGMPVINLSGELPNHKNIINNIKLTYNGEDISFYCNAEIKVQGASSANHPKKNFNIKLVDEAGNNNKIKIVDKWGKAHKYCLKANYIDYSQARNVVSAKIFGDIVRSRNDELRDLPNAGAIDGYPIVVYHDGEFLGIYTFNIPKDKWMFDMKDSDKKNQAILMTTTWNDAVSFRQYSTSGFELEFASNEDSEVDKSTKWVYDSMLNLIDFVMNNDGEDFINGIHQYADVEKCIDSMIYTFFICADDNISKNILWVTLDGKVWFSSMYDMDGTWGMRWNGSIEFDENTHPISALVDGKGMAPERKHSNYNLLWEKIYIYFFDRVCQRYKEIRKEILTEENITNYFTGVQFQEPKASPIFMYTSSTQITSFVSGVARSSMPLLNLTCILHIKFSSL